WHTLRRHDICTARVASGNSLRLAPLRALSTPATCPSTRRGGVARAAPEPCASSSREESGAETHARSADAYEAYRAHARRARSRPRALGMCSPRPGLPRADRQATAEAAFDRGGCQRRPRAARRRVAATTSATSTARGCDAPSDPHATPERAGPSARALLLARHES